MTMLGLTLETVDQLELEVLPQPANSPDLVPNNYLLSRPHEIKCRCSCICPRLLINVLPNRFQSETDHTTQKANTEHRPADVTVHAFTNRRAENKLTRKMFNVF